MGNLYEYDGMVMGHSHKQVETLDEAYRIMMERGITIGIPDGMRDFVNNRRGAVMAERSRRSQL